MSKQAPFQSTGASPTDGSHIASGKYQSRVVSLRSKYPNVTYPNDPNENYPRYKPPPGVKKLGKVTVLKFEGEQVPARTDLVEGRELQTFLQRSSAERDADTARRLYLVEGWDPDLIGVLGEHFQISPALLVRQYRSGMWERFHKSGNTPCLPSTFDLEQSWTIAYYEPRYLWPQLPMLQGRTWRAAENCRHISLSRVLGGFDNVGIVHRKASYWSRTSGRGGWDGKSTDNVS